MLNDHPKWKKLSLKTVYQGRMRVDVHSVELPDGGHTTYELLHSDSTNGGAAILIKTPNDELVLAYEYRFPLDEWIYDLPGGGKGKDETFEEAAIRECQEEVGVRPKSLTYLTKFYPTPALKNWALHLFFCDEFDASQIKLDDPSENVERVLVPITEFKKLVDTQKIIDPALLIAWHTACSQGHIRL